MRRSDQAHGHPASLPLNSLMLTIVRESRKLSQTALASATGVRQSMISQVEAGKARPSARLVARLAVVLRCPPSLLHTPLRFHQLPLTFFRKKARMSMKEVKAVSRSGEPISASRGDSSALIRIEGPADRPDRHQASPHSGRKGGAGAPSLLECAPWPDPQPYSARRVARRSCHTATCRSQGLRRVEHLRARRHPSTDDFF